MVINIEMVMHGNLSNVKKLNIDKGISGQLGLWNYDIDYEKYL